MPKHRLRKEKQNGSNDKFKPRKRNPSRLPTEEENKLFQADLEGKSVPGGALRPGRYVVPCNVGKLEKARTEYVNKIKSFGAVVIGYYENALEGVLTRCAEGHMSWPIPSMVMANRSGPCRICSGRDPATAARHFEQRVTELGARLLEPYQNANTPSRAICKEGHECFPCWGNLQNGQGLCLTCSGHDPKVGEAKFLAKVAELGGTPLEKYQNSSLPIRVLCKNGHECSPTWANLSHGQGLCLTCAAHDSKVVAVKFEQKVVELRGKLIGKYKNAHTAVQATCEHGHICWPRWQSLQKGYLCGKCVLNSSPNAKAFGESVAMRGGKLLEEYKGMNIPTLARCPNGHLCKPSLTKLKKGCGLCFKCVFRFDEMSARFTAEVEKQGGKLKGVFVKVLNRVEVICSKGHSCAPLPCYVFRGGGICATCNESRGERRVRQMLQEMQVEAKQEYRLTGLNNRSYDFGTDKFVIEFDGLQHFVEVPFFKGRTLAETQTVDIEKTLAALQSGRKVIRIHHTFLDEEEDMQLQFLSAALESPHSIVVYHPKAYGWLAAGTKQTIVEPEWSGASLK